MPMDEHQSVAPVGGPDDPRRFTDSGIEVGRAYAESDLPADLARLAGSPGFGPVARSRSSAS
jgi:methylmalonyl-CoA mutase N-terminal domain/subunit